MERVLILGVIFFLIARKMFTGAVDYVKDTAADTVLGEVIGLRNTEAAKAAEWIKTRLWLRKDYRDWLTDPKNKFLAKYNGDFMGANAAADIAEDIISSNFIIFDNGTIDRLAQWGLSFHGAPQDQPGKAVDAIKRIQNQAQALEVVEYYYLRVQKNLSAGLQWLPDEYMIEAWDHLKVLPTGVTSKTSNLQLLKLPNPF